MDLGLGIFDLLASCPFPSLLNVSQAVITVLQTYFEPTLCFGSSLETWAVEFGRHCNSLNVSIRGSSGREGRECIYVLALFCTS